MARRKLILTDSYPYHITIRTNNSDFFQLHMSSCWSIFRTELVKVIERYNFEVHSFLLMKNHYHLLVSTPEKNISRGLRFFHTEVSRKIGFITKRQNHLFGNRYYWKLVDDEKYYQDVLKYIFRNPVDINLCSRVQDYRFSTLYEDLTKEPNRIITKKLIDDINPSDPSLLDWYNTP